MAVDFIARYGIAVMLKRRDSDADADADWEGDEDLYGEEEEITAVYDPVFSDLGRDHPQRRTGKVLTYEDVSLGDLINDQEVTQVIPRYYKNGTFHYNEVSL
jgi:hypothetical protein